MVWVRFADDNETTPDWPDPEVLPEWAERFINTDEDPSGNYYQGTVSHYFYENSYGKMHVIGEVYYVTTDNDEDYYHQIAFTSGDGAARSAIEMEVLDKLDEVYNVDFTRYDNWTFGTFNHSSNPDDKVDMIWFMTRNLHDENPPAGRSAFGIGWATLDCPTHTRDGKTIIGGGLFGFPGSGIGLFQPHLYRPINSSTAVEGKYPLVNHVAHEMSHYFFGGGHFAYGGYIGPRRRISGFRPYAGGWAGTYSGYERWRLGWLSPTVVTANTDNLILWDLATTFDSTRNRLLQIAIPGSSQFFLVESRRFLSPFEARISPFGLGHEKLTPGLLVWHVIQESDHLPSTPVQKIKAEGRFRWRLVYEGNPPIWENTVIERDGADRTSGYSEASGYTFPDYQTIDSGLHGGNRMRQTPTGVDLTRIALTT